MTATGRHQAGVRPARPRGAGFGTGTAATGTRAGTDHRRRDDPLGGAARWPAPRREQVGRARLRKYVVTEQQQVTVPVSHEEVRLEREPITEANRGAAYSGPDITESEHEVTLHAERPVVTPRRCRWSGSGWARRPSPSSRPSRGEVRKERIEADLPGEGRRDL